MASKLKIKPENLDFDLPPSFIAQEPLKNREEAKLMVLNRAPPSISHAHFFDLAELLTSQDVLVINRAKVDQAKLEGIKKTGGRVSLILLSPTQHASIWSALIRPLVAVGQEIILGGGMTVTLTGRTAQGEYLVDFGSNNVEDVLRQFGEIPLPPYIKRNTLDSRHDLDKAYYQTVYASTPGSVAAPTAGLHFSTSLLNDLSKKGVELLDLVLHVGWGTFKPVNHISDHIMLPERYEVPLKTLRAIKAAKAQGKRIIAVGTTVTRVLESLPDDLPEQTIHGETALFIKPGFLFRHVSALITNFHVPRSTPISLVCSFAGHSLIEEAYSEAIIHSYRFFSYGDAMLIQ